MTTVLRLKKSNSEVEEKSVTTARHTTELQAKHRAPRADALKSGAPRVSAKELASIRELVRTARPHLATQAQSLRSNAYMYLHDAFVRESVFRDIMRGVEKRITDFGLSGKVIRISQFTNCRMLIEDEMRYGLKTVVIVGNDETMAKIMSRAADLDVTFALIPVGKKNNELAEVLGIPLNEEACNTLAARKVELLDYGIINGQRFFLSSLYMGNARLRITCDNTFAVKAEKENVECAVANVLPAPFVGREYKALHPQDGQLEIIIRPQMSGSLSGLFNRRVYSRPSVFPFKRLLMSAPRPFTMIADGRETQESTVEVAVAPKPLKMIVGKARMF